ncbi:MAG: 3-hydroxyacyl-CoA dehydrogenase NAD-binding domain-containing protein [Steroidobacteraceae bacterium]
MTPAPVTWRREGAVAIITVDHPPVNALSRAVRAGLVEAVAAANADAEVHALLLRCAGRTFIAGADISEFARPPEAPLLPEVVQAIEDSAKPVVVALHGTALGGGFEVAMAAHWRVATAEAKVGLPEVKLGIIPGAGGTQRLPRLVGVPHALEMITGGEPIRAAQAKEWGAIDEIAAGELDAAALAAAQRLGVAGGTPRRTGALPAPVADPAVFAAAEAAAAKKRGLIAPRHAVAAVRAACELPFAEGLKRERALMLELRASPQAAALRHAFFGEREVAQVPGLPRDTPLRTVERVGIIGAGTMGGGIAMAFANAGFSVTLLEAEAAALERGLETVRRNYATSVQRGSLAEAAMRERLARIEPTLEWSALAEADLLIEAVFEDFEVKRGVLERMDAIARPGAILATNTSYLDVAQLAACTRRPGDVVGMHFFSPANVMRLLENVRTPMTAPDVQATVMQVGRRLGKVAVMVGGSEGFVGNRMLAQRTREAFFLLEEGALPQQVDRVLVEFGFPLGPFAVGDLAGLDIGWRNRKARAHLRKPGVRDCDLLDQVCERGRLGQKTGAGWYRYEAGQRTGQPDPLIEQLILEHSRRKGIERRAITDQEILERCLYSMINEGAKILEEGVAARPVDIDMVWLHGYGFPAYRGGPMFHAQQLGLANVLKAIEHWREVVGEAFWSPAPLLRRRVEAGEGFYPAT